MKVSPDRIKARAEQLRIHGFKVRGGTVRAILELNAGARTQPSPRAGDRSPANTAARNATQPDKAA
jgi:hypothetical protein